MEAVEAKESVKKVEATVRSLQADVSSMKNDTSVYMAECEAWCKGVEDKIEACQFKVYGGGSCAKIEAAIE